VEVILLENVRNLGKFGHKVKVAKGYGRNFLIPQGKAVPASFDNMAKFEARRAELEIAAKDRLSAAQERAAVISAVTLKISAKAAEEGNLYGSIGTLEISKAFKLQGLEIDRNEIRLPDGPFREIGEFVIEIQLHAEVVTEAKLQIVSERA
jgi:large subunit ribosomal protein L9